MYEKKMKYELLANLIIKFLFEYLSSFPKIIQIQYFFTWNDNISVRRRLGAFLLFRHTRPLPGHINHTRSIHHPITKRMRKVPSHPVDSPIGGLEIGHVSTSERQMLNVPPVELRIDLQHQGDDSGRQWRAGAGARVGRGAHVMQVRGHHFALAGRT